MIRGRAHARTVVALLLFLTVLTLRFRTGVSAAISPSSSMLSLDQTDYYHSFLQFVEHIRATDVRIVDHCCRLLTYVLIKCCALACSPPPRCCYLYKQQSTGGYSTRNPIQHLFSADELLPLLHPHTLCNMVTIAPILGLMSIMKKISEIQYACCALQTARASDPGGPRVVNSRGAAASKTATKSRFLAHRSRFRSTTGHRHAASAQSTAAVHEGPDTAQFPAQIWRDARPEDYPKPQAITPDPMRPDIGTGKRGPYAVTSAFVLRALCAMVIEGYYGRYEFKDDYNDKELGFTENSPLCKVAVDEWERTCTTDPTTFEALRNAAEAAMPQPVPEE